MAVSRGASLLAFRELVSASHVALARTWLPVAPGTGLGRPTKRNRSRLSCPFTPHWACFFLPGELNIRSNIKSHHPRPTMVMRWIPVSTRNSGRPIALIICLVESKRADHHGAELQPHASRATKCRAPEGHLKPLGDVLLSSINRLTFISMEKGLSKLYSEFTSS
jgi:hypothetical protein